MKLNGKNIITDNDITVTGGKNLGDNLSNVLQNQQNEIDTLKSNVKWLYKYGGVGGSGGGAGGGITNWSIYATLGGRTITNGGTLYISNNNDTTSYQLTIAIKNGNSNYSVEFTYDDVKSGRTSLGPENGWKTTLSLNLAKNSFINITVTDGSDIKSVECDYITNPYVFDEIKLVNDTGQEYQNINKDVFILDAATNGFNMKVHYDIAIEAETSYYWEYLGITSERQVVEDKSGDIMLEFPKEYLTNDRAGLYDVACYISITPPNQEATILKKTVTFNLIPETLFLKIAPEVGTIYDEVVSNLINVHSYKTSIVIGLILRAYYGVNQNQTGRVDYVLYNETSDGWAEYNTGTIPITENINTTLQISFVEPGWKKVVLSCTLRGETYTVEKYVYLVETTTSYNWYKKSAEPSLTTYYRPGTDGTSNAGMAKFFGNNIYHQVYSSGQPEILGSNIIETPTSGSVGDILISMGLQYNEINNVNEPIAAFNYIASGEYVPFCTVYQNKISIEGYEIPIFLGRTDISEFDPTDPNKYHLVQISLKYVYRDNAQNYDYRQICVYIDGVLEGAVNNWITYTREIYQVVLYPANYSLNLLEVANFSNSVNRSISDVDISYYHNTYKIKSSSDSSVVSDDETSIIDNLFDYDSLGNASIAYGIENQLIKLSGSAAISQISSCVKIPSLVCKVERILRSYDNTGKTVFEWLNTSYSTEQDSDQTVDVGLQGFRCPTTLRWYNKPNGGGSGISFESSKEITGAKLFNDNNTEFYLRLQGSSTMRYKSKNLTLGVRNTSEEDNAPVPVFSPNFKRLDTSTFLPDNAFTLKADVVDSSHSNNTSLGKFINDIYAAAGINGARPIGDLKDHVKTCLEGFPILMFLEVSDESSGTAALDTEYYYLGIYNFNLGRENYLNLGYVDLKVLHENNDTNGGILVREPDEYSFAGLNIPSSNYQPINNLVVAEVQGNNPLWDFSQYHSSILFQVDGLVGDSTYMFGDIVYGSGQITTYKSSISRFVKSVSAAGNYIFNSLGKNFEPVVNLETGQSISDIAYRKENTVPDADIQFIRKSDGSSYEPINREENSSELNPTRGEDRFNINLVKSCILETESGEDVILPYLDYNTVLYYYTICMAFGLVDSVQKNLNIKTWNGKTFGLYFYDMDTALGTSNSGGDTSYFCFTDFWKTAITKLTDDGGEDILGNNGKPVYKNSGANIYRDYYPKDESLPTGYDIPSTYLFSIAKYAACFSKNLSGQDQSVNLDFPQNIWGRWRTKRSSTNAGFTEVGILENSDRFITEYFEGHLKDVPNVLLNLNYRVKYLYSTTGTGFNDTDSGNLKGRQIEKVRDWLDSRFHILDAYFNLGKETVLIKETPDSKIYEPICTVDLLNTNPDIQILHDIFSPYSSSGAETTLNREGTLKFRVSAKNYTPLIHRHANAIERFLLEDENTEYEIEVVYNGNQTSKFGGSDGWTYLDSLNSFIQTLKNSNAFSLNTKKLEYVEGTEGTLTGDAKFSIPSAKSLVLTSPNYSCKVSIDDTFYNLNKLDISRSQIQLNVTGSKLTQILASNIKSEKVELLSCNNLKNITLAGSTINEFTIQPVWLDAKDSIDLSGVKVTTLNITGKGGELIIKGSDSIKYITFSEFSKVTINSCPNLTTVSCNDSSDPKLENCSITSCGLVTSISLISNKLKQLDLTDCVKLTELELRKLDATESALSLESLQTLKLKGTSVTKIKRTIKNGNVWEEPASRKENILYLTDYPNLIPSNFTINNNKSVEYIKVGNDEKKPFEISNTFSECNSLKRIYGHIKLTRGSSFYNCNNFSIHGYLLSDDQTEIVLNKGSETIKYNGVSVVNGSGRVLHPLEMGGTVVKVADESTGKYRMVFQAGDGKVTNVSFSNSNSVLNNAFSGTSCTIFDIYYVFQNLYEAGNSLDAASCFYNTKSKKGSGILFEWNKDVDNSPNRYTFKDWGTKIKSINSIFRSRVKGRVRLFSTYENKGTTIGGLLYYLPNVSSINLIFYGGNFYTDNKVFTSSTGKFDNLTSIQYFSPSDFIDNINTLNYSDIFTESGSYSTAFLSSNLSNIQLGNLNGLFNQCNKLTSLWYFCNSTQIINYDKFEIELPNTLKHLIYSFVTSTAIGKLDFVGIFDKNEIGNRSLVDLCQSFYVSQLFSSWLSSKVSGVTTEYKDAYIEYYDSMFERFPNLARIGYLSSGIDASGSVVTSEYSPFGGKLIKVLRDGTFPTKIIENLPDLTMFTGFFRNCDTGIYSTAIDLPGDMFKRNPKLENISRCFQDMKARINLTPNGFERCTLLKDVSYLFCNSAIVSGDTSNLYKDSNKIGIVSSIPYKFFYHGHAPSEITKTIYGSNKIIEKDISGESGWEIDADNRMATKTVYIEDEGTKTYIYQDIFEFIGDTAFKLTPTSALRINEYDLEGNLVNSTYNQIGNTSEMGDVKYEERILSGIKSVNNTISKIEYCFQGQGWITHYVNENNHELEPNLDYQPFNYLYDISSKVWVDKSSTRDDRDKTFMWSYDGTNRLENCHYIDEDIDLNTSAGSSIVSPPWIDHSENCTTNFFCPPDLLRYCSEDANISYLFNYSGYTDQLYLVNEIGEDLQKYVGFGITGRICPYLLKPVSKTTSLEGFLTFSPRLSYYYLNDNNINDNTLGDIYLIPKTFFDYANNINNLKSAFKGFNFPNGCRLDVFSKLTKSSLNLDYTFQYPYFHGNSAKKFSLEGVFTGNTVSSAIATFSIENNPESLPQLPGRFTGQYVHFGINFNSQKLPKETDSSNYKVRSVYDGYSESTVTFDGYKKDDNTSYEFRIQNAQNQTPYNYRVRTAN